MVTCSSRASRASPRCASARPRFASASSVAAVRYYDKVAARTAAGVFWTVADRNGTPVVQTDADILESDRHQTLPSASPAATSPTGRAVRASLVARRTAPGSPTSPRLRLPALAAAVHLGRSGSGHRRPGLLARLRYAGHSRSRSPTPRGAVASASTSAAALPTGRSRQRRTTAKTGKPKAGPSKKDKKPSAKGDGPSIGKEKRECHGPFFGCDDVEGAVERGTGSSCTSSSWTLRSSSTAST